MSKAVLISIKPKWCELIANGKKTIEIRKKNPNIEMPFKCYIYCTKQFEHNNKYGYKIWASYGKVIGEFVCDNIDLFTTDYRSNIDKTKQILNDACIDISDAIVYQGENEYLCAWHISDLKIYDKPKELSEFRSLKKPCAGCEYDFSNNRDLCHFPNGKECRVCYLKRPPQSWCYVEELTL